MRTAAFKGDYIRSCAEEETTSEPVSLFKCFATLAYAHHSLWLSDWNGNCEHWKLIAEFKLSLKISATHTINMHFSGKFAWKSHNLSGNLRFSDFCFLHFCSFGGLRFFNYCSIFIQLYNIAKVLALYKSYWVAMVHMCIKNLNTRMAVRIHDDVFSCLLNSDFSSLGPRLYGPAESRKVGQKGYSSSLVNFSERLYEKFDLLAWANSARTCSKQHSRMLWLSYLHPLDRGGYANVYGEKLAQVGGSPYHHKRVTHLGGSPLILAEPTFFSDVKGSPRQLFIEELACPG